MKKSTRIVKRLFALFLVVLMSIESIGAVVSDNDGSAFITKAEFDSLKNNFQSQIDQYNTSIDSKIDGAIASYLAGINVKKTQVLELPTSQKIYKTLDDINYPANERDIFNLNFRYLWVRWYGRPTASTTSDYAGWGADIRLTYNTTKTPNRYIFHEEDGHYAILRGFATNFKKSVSGIMVNSQNSGQIETIVDRFKNIQMINQGSNLTTETPLTYARDAICPEVWLLDSNGNGIWAWVRTDWANFWSTNYGSINCSYDQINEPLALPFQTDYPLLWDNTDHVRGGDCRTRILTKDQYETAGYVVSGDMFYGKQANNTTAYGINFNGTTYPEWAHINPEISDRNVQYTKSGTTYYASNKHVAYDATTYFTPTNRTLVTDLYSKSIIDALKDKYPGTVATTVKDVGDHPRNQGGDFYILTNGLVLQNFEADGEAVLEVKNPSFSAVTLWIDNEPRSNYVGVNTNKSEASRNGGIVLNANETKKITFDVDKGFYFFKFGKTNGTGAEITNGGQIEIISLQFTQS